MSTWIGSAVLSTVRPRRNSCPHQHRRKQVRRAGHLVAGELVQALATT